MKISALSDNLRVLSLEEASLRTFRTESFTEAGMLYNSYLLDTGDGFVSLGSLPARFAAEWAEAVKECCGVRPVTHMVLFGVDGDSAAWKALRILYPELRLVCSQATLFNLAGDGHGIRSTVVYNEKKFTAGNLTLEFRAVDRSLYMLDCTDGILFSADAFGSDCAAGAPVTSLLQDKSMWLRGAELYYADIYGLRRRKAMEEAVALVRESGARLLCPAFGCAVDDSIDALLSVYARTAPEKGTCPKLAVVYAPGSSCETLAPQIAQGAKESGSVEAVALDLSAMSREDVLAELSTADALLFGVPSMDCKPVWDIITSLKPQDVRGKYASVFHTSGLHSEIPDFVRSWLSLLGMNMTAGDFFTTGMPSEADLKNAVDYGFGLGCLLQAIPNTRKPSLVKCLVCGEIFDATLGKCPVCGVGLDQCVPVAEDAATFRSDTERRYVIVGGGIAGVSAAEAIRRRDDTGSILILSAEDCLPINRPMLTKDLVTVANDPDSLRVHDAKWYESLRIGLRLGVTVSAVDPAAKTVALSGGETVPYDRLIWAAGAECFVPPFKGKDTPGVIAIRHLSDSRELEHRMHGAKNAVVIGGGVLGLEAASELVRANLHVTVLEATPQIIGRQADAVTAQKMRGFMAAMHVDCFEGVSIEEITGEGQVTGVRIADGRCFPADFVIVSCGARANTAVLKAAGAELGRAVKVDARMRTSLPDIYACGDCCEFNGINYQLWQEASSQGRTAGANAAGEELPYHGELMGLSMDGFGTSLFVLGDPGKIPDRRYQLVRVEDDIRSRSECYWFYGGTLQGAVLIGAPEKTGDVQTAVMTRAPYTSLEGKLF